MTTHHVECPVCHNVHIIDAAHFENVESRLLKCATCEHIWRHFKNPLPEFEKILREPPPPFIPPDSHIRVLGAFKNKDNYKRAVHHYHMDWWLLVIASVICVMVLIREVGTIPNITWFMAEIKSFFSTFKQQLSLNTHTNTHDNLTLNVLTSHLSLDGLHPKLTVKGEITNHSDETQNIHAIEVMLMEKCEKGNGELCMRHSWIHTDTIKSLKPGDRHTFETSGDAVKAILPETILLQWKQLPT